jgi:hypothetical protein
MNGSPCHPPAAIQSKQDVLLQSLRAFYRDPDHLRVLRDVLVCRGDASATRVSLRILDWLVTNYSKKHNVVYLIPGEDGVPKTFNMFLEYKSQLKAYSKRFFDPFCRRERLDFQDGDGQPFQTTVGQLNFFRWALQHGVVEYGQRHGPSIEHDMLHSIRHRTQVGATGKCKRRELSKAAIKGCTKTHVKVTVRFA